LGSLLPSFLPSCQCCCHCCCCHLINAYLKFSFCLLVVNAAQLCCVATGSPLAVQYQIVLPQSLLTQPVDSCFNIFFLSPVDCSCLPYCMATAVPRLSHLPRSDISITTALLCCTFSSVECCSHKCLMCSCSTLLFTVTKTAAISVHCCCHCPLLVASVEFVNAAANALHHCCQQFQCELP